MDFVKELVFWILVIVIALQNEGNSAVIPNEDVPYDEMTNYILPEYENLENIQAQKNNFHTSRTVKELVPFVVEISRGYIKFQTTGFDEETVALTTAETEGVQRLSLALVELLNESQLSSPSNETEKIDRKTLNPIITITHSGISLRFVNVEEDAPPADEIPPGQRHVLWKFVSEFAKNIFEDNLKRLNLTDANGLQFDFPIESSADDFKQFENCIATLWSIMKVSVKYAEDNFKEWTTSLPAVEAKSTVLDAVALKYEAQPPAQIYSFLENQKEKKN